MPTMTSETILFGLQIDLWLKLISLVGTAGVWLWTRRRKPRLEAFFTHGAAHQLPPAQGQQGPLYVHTHSLVVRNSGYAPAVNVRVTHGFYPPHTTHSIWPAVPNTVVPNPPHGNEIVFERIRPKDQIQISYLYGPQTTLDQFHTMVRSDEGSAQFFPINHVRIFPVWARLFLLYLLVAGIALTIYIVLKVSFVLFVIA